MCLQCVLSWEDHGDCRDVNVRSIDRMTNVNIASERTQRVSSECYFWHVPSGRIACRRVVA